MDEEKKIQDDTKKEVSIPFLMEHMSMTNRRMFHALLAVCATFVLTIVIFVVGYTVREKNWLNTIKEITPQVEVPDGIHEQPDS